MLSVAKRFSDDMNQVLVYMDLVDATMQLAKSDCRKFRSRHVMARQAISVHEKAAALGAGRVLAYDGAFLTACAQFELCVRELIEAYVTGMSAKMQDYNRLPKGVRDWYPEGCGRLLLNLRQSKLQHLKASDIFTSISTCVTFSKNKPYRLVGEAFSDTEHNFRAKELASVFPHLGIDAVWNRLSGDPGLASFFGNSNPASIESMAEKKLDWAMETRNNIVHRGRQYHTASDSEVRDAARFFSVLIVSLATVLDRCLRALRLDVP